jgi:hypothetical protein
MGGVDFGVDPEYGEEVHRSRVRWEWSNMIGLRSGIFTNQGSYYGQYFSGGGPQAWMTWLPTRQHFLLGEFFEGQGFLGSLKPSNEKIGLR